MRASFVLMLGACLFAGCGDTIGDQMANSPEIQQRLMEIEKRRKDELERQKKQLDEIQNSTSAALRAAEELGAKSASSAAEQPSADADPKPSAPPVPSKTLADPPAPVTTAESSPTAAPVTNPQKAATASSAKWAQLRAGMTSEAVKDLLGPPTATSEDRTLVYWHYGSRAMSGRVAFLAGSGQLVAWEAPVR